jgi:hypothetical protein
MSRPTIELNAFPKKIVFSPITGDGTGAQK